MARSLPQSAQRYLLTLIFGTDANVRLRELSRHGGLLSSPLLAARSGLARASVWSALRTLEEIGIVAAEGTGKARLYRLNDRHPLATSLGALFDAEEARYAWIREAVSSAASAVRPALLAAWIFGSVARGEDRPGSDLDVAIVAPSEEIEPALQGIREALAVSSKELGFVPSVVGLSSARSLMISLAPDDITRLSSKRDP